MSYDKSFREQSGRKGVEVLNPRHFKIIDLCIKGWSTTMIGKHLGMGTGQVNIVMKSPNFQNQLAIRRASYEEIADEQTANEEDEVASALKRGTVDAVKKLVSCVESENESIAIKSAMAILDRGGYPKVQKIDGNQISQAIIINVEAAKRIEESITLDKD